MTQGGKMAKKEVQYLQGADFTVSLKALMQKGGQYQKAAERVQQAWAKAHLGGHSHAEVFVGLTTTNNGENRIENCVKFDLTGFARLVTTYSNDICIFLFAGDHTATDKWLDKNKGMNFIASKQGDRLRVDPVFVSNTKPGAHGLIQSEIDWMSNGPVIDQLPERYRDKLLKGLDAESVGDIRTIESDTDEDVVLAVVSRIADSELADATLDVLLALRSSDFVKAKNRIDLLERVATPVAALSENEARRIVSSDATVRIQDVDPVLFEHFVKTADFKQWMLYLHPVQREIVDRDFTGPARLAGVSGSGKTCVVIHRALRIARQSQDKRVLILTLNEALARLISELIDEECGTTRPANITIKSVFDLSREKLIQLNPKKAVYYGKKTTKSNAFAVSEHIDDIWEEYYHCHNNNLDADVMFEVERTLLVRNVFPQDYLRQELDYVRSAFAPSERNAYLDMERTGRVIPLERRYRESVLRGIEGWEKKMNVVGAIDDTGIVTALYPHLDQLKAEFDHVLVDEVQDLGTLELRIIRRLTREGSNDLFLCGDAAQTVHTKHSDMKAAQIDLPPARWIKLNQNYRNSRQILTAAYNVLTRSFDAIPKGTTDLEILQPEYANFSSAKPLLLRAGSVQEELAMGLAYIETMFAGTTSKKVCIALCGYTQAAIEELSAALGFPALCGETDLSAGTVFLSDLEQTKGFEFDLMLILNCCERVIPHPDLPEHEYFRELCKLYVVLTRAKTELVVSFHGEKSRFISKAEEHFNHAAWAEHVSTPRDLRGIFWPKPALQQMGDLAAWSVPGRAFLRMREAVGLSPQVQEEILLHVTGIARTKGNAGPGRKKMEWKAFLPFYEDMKNPRVRIGIMSDEAAAELHSKLDPLIQKSPEDIDEPSLEGAGSPVPQMESLQADGELPEDENGSLSLESTPRTVGWVTLHRHEGVLGFTQVSMTAHTLASLCVAQGAEDVDGLSVGFPMDYAVLGFLIPRQVLAPWIQDGHLRQLRNNPNAMALTKVGLDECKSRISATAAEEAQSPYSTATSAEQICKYRRMILTGLEEGKKDRKFYKKSFKLMVQENEALA